MSIAVSVKKSHIEKGECKSPQRCAIAAARMGLAIGNIMPSRKKPLKRS
jgi:hypothetical protein